MKGKLDIETIRNKIHNGKDATIKSIADIVAFKISKSIYDKGPENNFLSAEKTMAEFVSENFDSMDEFYERLSQLDGGIKGMQAFADTVYQCYTDRVHLSFDAVKDSISSKKDITLKTITNLVAYKISQTPNDKGSDMNFISAQTFVAEYVSKNFKNKMELENKISKLGKDVKGLNAFADIVYKHFVKKTK
ncbi:MAG: hypothetical protein ACE5KZ_09580 [Candidatus Scalinduaceae bacterium]